MTAYRYDAEGMDDIATLEVPEGYEPPGELRLTYKMETRKGGEIMGSELFMLAGRYSEADGEVLEDPGMSFAQCMAAAEQSIPTDTLIEVLHIEDKLWIAEIYARMAQAIATKETK